MHYVFRVGPIEVGRDRAFAYALVSQEGAGAISIEPNDQAGLRAVGAKKHGAAVEPSMAKEAAKIGLIAAELPDWARDLKVEFAVGLAHPGSKPGGWFELAAAAVGFDRAAPWTRIDSDTPAALTLTGAVSKKFEVAIFGASGESFGLALYPRPGSIAKISQLSGPNVHQEMSKIDVLSVTWESEPEFAVRAMKELFDVDFYPGVFVLRGGKPVTPTNEDVETLIAALSAAIVWSDGEAQPIEVSTSRGGTISGILEVAPRLPFVPEIIRGGADSGKKVGRNDPCPCGSGKKYKKCCLDKEGAVQDPIARAASLHEIDRTLARDIALYAERRWAGFTNQARTEYGATQLPEIEGEDALFGHWLAYHAQTPDQVCAAEGFARDRRSTLSPAEGELFDRELEAWISIWEVLEVDPGNSMVLLDLLTGEERLVLERSGSIGLPRRTALLARVVDAGGFSILCGCHPTPLEPKQAAAVVSKLRKKWRAGSGELEPEVVFENTLSMIHAWREAAHERLTRANEPAVLQNSDGEPILICESTFDIQKGRLPEITRILSAEPDVVSQDAGSMTIVRREKAAAAQTALAGIVLEKDRMKVMTNSVERDGKIRARLEQLLGNRIRYRARAQTALPEMPSGGAGPQIVEMQHTTVDPMITTRDMYRRWLEDPHPELDGLTPRAAAAKAASRRKLHVVLKDIENHATTPEMHEITDWLREQLDLDIYGEKLSGRKKATRPAGKLSEAVMDLAAPAIHQQRGLDATEEVIALAIEVWNKEVLATVTRPLRSPLPRPRRKIGDEMRREWSQEFIDRKRTLFAADRRLIGEWQLITEPGGFSLMTQGALVDDLL